MADKALCARAERGRVRFINIRNIYASSSKEIRLTLVDPSGAERHYEFTASFGENFLDIRRGDTIELLWEDREGQRLHGIKNLRTGLTYVATGGCLLSAVPMTLAVLTLGFLAISSAFRAKRKRI